MNRPDTHSMVVMHRAFRHQFRLLPALIRETPGTDSARARVVADHATDTTTALHAHHTSEDEVIWPRLLSRAPARSEVVHRMQQQHDTISDYLGQIKSKLPVWATEVTATQGQDLADVVEAAATALEAHLDQEEREILPQVAEHLTIAEWEELGERMRSGMPRALSLRFLGMVLEAASPDERAQITARLPPRVRIMWKLVGRRRYQRRMRKVHGSPVTASATHLGRS